MALEIDSHGGKIASLTEQVEELSSKSETTAEQVEQIGDLHRGLLAKWAQLEEAVERRTSALVEKEALERLIFDVENAEQWLTERELIAERPIKVIRNNCSKISALGGGQKSSLAGQFAVQNAKPGAQVQRKKSQAAAVWGEKLCAWSILCPFCPSGCILGICGLFRVMF